MDLACGYGNTAITARAIGAKVTGIDITPKLLALAKEEEKISNVSGIDCIHTLNYNTNNKYIFKKFRFCSQIRTSLILSEFDSER